MHVMHWFMHLTSDTSSFRLHREGQQVTGTAVQSKLLKGCTFTDMRTCDPAQH